MCIRPCWLSLLACLLKKKINSLNSDPGCRLKCHCWAHYSPTNCDLQWLGYIFNRPARCIRVLINAGNGNVVQLVAVIDRSDAGIRFYVVGGFRFEHMPLHFTNWTWFHIGQLCNIAARLSYALILSIHWNWSNSLFYISLGTVFKKLL